MKKTRHKIYMQQWLYFHPYEKPDETDYYYFNLCKKIHQIIESPKHYRLTGFLPDKSLTALSCFLVCYFEDVISKTSIWQAFTNEHKKLYGKYLPFYEYENYYPDEINPEDIYFLLWYFFSCTLYDKSIFLPVHENIISLGDDIYEILEEEYEYAPENDNLKKFLTIPPEEDDYYAVRIKIEWLIFNSYLFHFTNIEFENEIIETFKKEKDRYILEKKDLIINNLKDNYIINKPIPLLALKGKEWLAAVLGEKHALYTDILNISEKKTGYYIYQKQDENNLYFQHIATDTLLVVTKKSMDVHPDFKEESTMFFISFVKWKNEWWFSGIYYSFPYEANLVLDEKNSIESRALFSGEKDKQLETLQSHYEIFLKYNNNRPIAFLKNSEEMEKFVQGYYEFFNKSLQLSKKEVKEAKERSKKKGLLIPEKKIKLPFHNLPGIVFFNKNSGIEMIFGYNNIIPDPQNPYYDKNANHNEAVNLFYSEHVGGELAAYLLKNYKLPGAKFPGEEDENTLMDNMDFMLRFWKPKNYHSKPEITLI